MKYTRVYADSNGESHFEDVEVEFSSVDFAPPAPPLELYTESSPDYYYFHYQGGKLILSISKNGPTAQISQLARVDSPMEEL